MSAPVNAAAATRPTFESTAKQTFYLVDDRGTELTGADLSFSTAFADTLYGDDAGPEFSWEITPEVPFHARASAAGHVAIRARGLTPKEVRRTRLELKRLATIRVEGDVSAVEVCGRAPESDEDAFRLEAAPGPLDLIVHRATRRPLAISLELAPGAERRLLIP